MMLTGWLAVVAWFVVGWLVLAVACMTVWALIVGPRIWVHAEDERDEWRAPR